MSEPHSASTSKTSAANAANSAGRQRALTPQRRLLFAVLYAIYIGLLCWFAIVGYFWIRYQVVTTGTFTTDQLWQLRYPKLAKLDPSGTPIKHGDGHFDVLLLGASVLEQVVEPLRSRLPTDTATPIRIHNLCTAAHTTRDSYFKFQRLNQLGAEFDLIVLYHGINEARMNCCRPGEFRDDYTHCDHYASLERQLKQGRATVTEIAMGDVNNLISLGNPAPELLDYGRDIKTARPLRRNIEDIVQTSQQKQLPVLLMTFAYYLPANYSREAFDRQALDYGVGQHAMAAEVWGRPKNLIATLDAHNRQIKSLAKAYANVLFIDQQQRLTANGRNFSDPCHLTDEGIKAFVDNLLPVVLQATSTRNR